MKLVIDISEEDYKKVSIIVDMGLGINLDESICNGTPLEDELEKIKEKINSEDVNCRYDEWAYSSGLQKAIEVIDNRIEELKGE